MRRKNAIGGRRLTTRGDVVPDEHHPEQGQEADRLTRDLRLRLIELTAELGEREADRLWTRYSLMLTLNAGLMAVISYALSQSLYLITSALGLFGMILAVLFYRIVAFSQFYESRWRKDMSELINGDSLYREFLRSRSNLGPREKRPFKGSSTGDAKAVVVGVGAFWCFVIIYCVLNGFHLVQWL